MSSTRAYTTLEVKASQSSDGKRRFTGIASTIETDRMQDVVEPRGMQAKLPVPLLWQHDARQPIGWVRATRVTDKQIEVDCEIADIEEEGDLKARLATAWQSITSGLVRGLSIGFRSIESARIDGTFGLRFSKWELLELSAVTVPANAQCGVSAIKSADELLRRTAPGAHAGSRVVRLDPADIVGKSSPPGASGTKQARRPGVVYLK